MIPARHRSQIHRLRGVATLLVLLAVTGCAGPLRGMRDIPDHH